MIKIRKNLLLLMFCFSCSIHAMAQTDYYYYYYGNKIPLTLNENKVVVHIPKESKEVSERIQSNVQVLATIKDDSFDIFIISRSDYEKFTSQDSWKEDSKSVMLTLSFFTEQKVEVFETGHLSVELKKEEDIDLLTSYMEKYKLRITFHRPSMPLWYGLGITLDSEKGPLVCANELWESGDFASSVPDLAGGGYIDHVSNITIAPTEERSHIYDLQGRRLTDKPSKGVYIESGKKRVVK